jgi:cell wall-associated NlpC family hydrolase
VNDWSVVGWCIGPCCPGGSGFDCSGLTSHCYKAGGYNIPRTASAQQSSGHACSGGAQAGDLLV